MVALILSNTIQFIQKKGIEEEKLELLKEAERRAEIEKRAKIIYDASIIFSSKNPENNNEYFFKISTDKMIRNVRFGLVAVDKTGKKIKATEYLAVDVLEPNEPYIISYLVNPELCRNFNFLIRNVVGPTCFENKLILAFWVYTRYSSYNDPKEWDDYGDRSDHYWAHYEGVIYKE